MANLNASDYEVNLEDETLKGIEAEKDTEIGKIETDYGTRIDESDSMYKDLADEYLIDPNDGKTTAVEAQQDALDASLNVTLQGLQNNIDQSEKDYKKEASASYVDYTKATSKYGVNAERVASQGMAGGTGYIASIETQKYVAHQNRVATAREVHNKNVIAFTQLMNEAKAQNNVAKAQIAFDAFVKRSEIMIQGMTAHNNLLSEMADKKLQVNTYYDNKWKDQYDILQDQQNTELEIDKYNATTSREERAQNDALIESYLKAGLPVPESLLANSTYTQADVDAFIGKYNTDKAEADKASAREEALEWFALGKVPNEELLKKTGWTEDEIAHLKDSYVVGKDEYKDENGNKAEAPTKPDDRSGLQSYFGGDISNDSISALEEDGLLSIYVKDGATHFKVDTSQFKKVDGKEGGSNLSGINRNAYISWNGIEYKSTKLVDKLMDEYGLTKSQAKEFVLKIQKQLGIDGKSDPVDKDEVNKTTSSGAAQGFTNMAYDNPGAQAGAEFGKWLGNKIRGWFN